MTHLRCYSYPPGVQRFDGIFVAFTQLSNNLGFVHLQ